MGGTLGEIVHRRHQSAKPRVKAYKLADGSGLYLLVKSNGRRYWRMNDRPLGQSKSLSFGVWPEVGLADPRERRDYARKLMAKGIDPHPIAHAAIARNFALPERAIS